MLNKIILMGRRDPTTPELRRTQNGTAVTRLLAWPWSVTLRTRTASGPRTSSTSWHGEPQRRFVAKYFTKGRIGRGGGPLADP